MIIIIIIIILIIRINNDLVIHRQVMTTLLRVRIRIKLTHARSRVTTDLHSGGGYRNALAQIESICTFKLDLNCLIKASHL